MVAPNREQRAIGLSTATAVVAANMIGTGVFTSLGFQLLSCLSHLTCFQHLILAESLEQWQPYAVFAQVYAGC